MTERRYIINPDGFTWGYSDDGAEYVDPFPDRPYRCLNHKVVDFGTKRGYCKVCDVDLFMDANGYFKERSDGDS